MTQIDARTDFRDSLSCGGRDVEVKGLEVGAAVEVEVSPRGRCRAVEVGACPRGRC